MERKDWDRILDTGGYKRVQHIFRKELICLTKDESCCRFGYPNPDIGTSGSIQGLDLLQPIIQAKPPRLIQKLNVIARQGEATKKNPLKVGCRQAFWVMQFLFAVQRTKCSGFAKVMALYLVDGGAKKRTIDMLASLGVCTSYITTHDVLKQLERISEHQVRLFGSRSDSYLTYDNFDFAENRATELLGNRKVFNSITTALAIRGTNIPRGGLKQQMWRPRHQVVGTDIWPVTSSINELFHEVRTY